MLIIVPPSMGRKQARLVPAALAMSNIQNSGNNHNESHNCKIIGCHFLPSLVVGTDNPWHHAPKIIVNTPLNVPICQSSGRKNAVAMRATPSIPKMFDQYLSMVNLRVLNLTTFAASVKRAQGVKVQPLQSAHGVIH